MPSRETRSKSGPTSTGGLMARLDEGLAKNVSLVIAAPSLPGKECNLCPVGLSNARHSGWSPPREGISLSCRCEEVAPQRHDETISC